MAQGFVQVLINLDQYKELLRPPGVTDLDWANVWNQFKARFNFDNLSGPPFLSIYSLLEAVAPESNELYSIGQGTRDLGELLQFALLQSTGVLPKTVLASSVDLNLSGGPIDLFLARTYDGSMLARNKAGMFGDGWSSNFDISAVTDTKGNVVIAAPGALRSFTLNADGTFSANSGAFGSLALVAGAYVLTETDGSTVQFRADGRLAAMTDANGNTVTANWSVANQLIGVSTSTGQSLTFTYNGQGRVATATDSEGQVTTYTYDASGAHLLSVTTAAGTTAYAYKAAPGTPSDSALVSITYQDGTHHFFEYGTNGRLTAEFGDGNADKVTYNHGTPGKVVVSDALGHETTLFYDSDGNIARVLDANAHATNLSYDDFGNLTKVVTPGGSVASYAYDSFGHVTSFIDPLGGTISSSYDALGHIASLTDQRGNTMTYGHDAKGNLTSIGYADSTQTTFIATAAGQLHSVTNARSQTAAFTYDAGGHVIAKNFSDGTNESYTYDSHGNLTSATARNGGATSYTYDAADRLTSVTDAIGRTESFTYDAAGRRVERVDPDGTVTKYSYDAAGRLSELRDGVDGLLVKYSYDAAGQLSRIDNGNGTHTSYTHDAVGNVTAIKNFSAVNAVISQEVYNYTVDSQVSTKSTLDGTWTYAYDKAGQLTHAVFTSTNASVANQDISYAYDAAGNRISTTVDGVVTNYTANALNQYTSATGVSYTYDADGNLKTKTDSSGSWTYTYDIENQLTSVVGPGGQTWSYSYDALGNRIASTHNGITETYVIDPFGLGNVAQTYTSGGTLSATYSYGYGLAAAIGAGSTSYYTTDLTGNVTGLTNGSGNLTDSYFYDPFGDVTHVTGTSTNPFQFNGAHGVSTDSSELSFMRYRYYDNTDGRFIERDPINLNGGTNLYEYVANNPISFVDPSGLSYVNIGVNAGDGPAVGVGFIVDDYGNTYLQLGGGAGYGAGASATYGPGAVQQGFGVSVQGGIGEGFDGGFGIDENGRPTGGEAGPSVGAGFIVLLTYTWKLPWNINPFGNPGPSPDFSWSDNDGFPGGGGTQHGSPGNGSGTSVSMYCCVSVDESGRWVAYESPDSAITTDDTNGKNDIFLYQTADIVLPAGSIQRILTPTGEQGNGDSFNPVLSGDGWWVSFTTLASNFAAEDTNGASDVFLTGFDRLTQRISVSTAGVGGDAASYLSSVSYDASQVAFVSEASNLVAGDTNGFADIFLRDINLATTELISKGAGSAKANGDSTMPAISANGDLVAFVSSASNLVAGDTNGERDIFLRDRVAETTTLVTKGLGGTQANGSSWAPAITPDGRYIAYFSYASNLVAGDANGKADVFITDRVTGVTERVSVGLSNVESNGDSGGKPVTGPFPGNAWGVDVSSDGRYVSFISEASNLVAGDTNGKADVFLYDRLAHIMTLVSKNDSGDLASGGPLGSLYAGAVAISGDASVIAYISDATNILASDTNASADIFVHKSNDPIMAKAGTLAGDTMVGSDTRDAFAGFDSDDVLNGVAGDDLLYGGNGNDRLTGGLGADFMDGGNGSDRMFGGAGDDTYLVGDVSDTVVELAQSGQDGVQTLLNGYILAANVEELALLGSADLNTTGNSGNNLIFGNSGANVINGGAGNDVITAGTGSDSLAGGSGNDRALGEAGDDIEHGGIGDDTLNGGDGNDQLFGEAGDDILSGDSGDDVLDGGDGTDTLDGGVGKDTMRGGAGGDTYVVDDAGDVVIEASAGAGEIDTVKSTISYTLTKYVENLVLAGAALNGTGNSGTNNITGNDLANTLDGQGGSDVMVGGLGDDIYVVDNQGDSVQEDLGQGTDMVRSSVDYLLSTNVENLQLLGSGDINGSGNELINKITGNDGDNRLDGGLAADTLAGGLGNDTYVVDRSTDVVSEAANGGQDRVESSSSYVLGANVEDLQLYVSLDSVARNGKGNGLANTILGSDGANTIDGVDGDDTLIGNGGNDKLTGGNGNDLLDGGLGADTLTGGAGDDAYVVDQATDTVTEAVGEGTDTITSSVTLTLGVNVENLTLTGFLAVNGAGNDLANTIIGNDGNNSLSGLAGADVMIGGTGDDTYRVDNVGDVVIEDNNAGTDTVRASINFILGQAVENLTLLGSGALAGTGNSLSNEIIGNSGISSLKGMAGDDILSGDSGDDVLDGGDGTDTLDGGVGKDTMRGGAGGDTYVVDDAGDVVIEASAGAGEIDVVKSTISYTLTKYVENLVLMGTALNGTGNSLINNITGNELANTLDGQGGSDGMFGGLGDDTYVVDNQGDFVQEDVGQGTDTVRSSVDYLLSTNVENLQLLGSGDINGSGNELINKITGNDGDNRLDGGLAADTLAGGLGNDTYVVDRSTDVVSEAANGGQDRVESSSSYVLGANVEDLQLYVSLDSVARNGKGNGLANTILGSDGANTIDGVDGDDTLIGNGGNDKLTGGNGNDLLDGGLGADTLTGGAGDDAYVVDQATDTVTEAVGEGTDTIISSVTLTLGANVENLTLTGFSAINGVGNDLANTIIGNDSNNSLSGLVGADVMIGGTGDDTYRVDNAGDVVIEDNNAGTDTVRASVSYVISDDVENLELLSGGSTGRGNVLNNIITGNSSSNILVGGIGSDTITGGGGADRFRFEFTEDSDQSVGGSDLITDFVSLEGDRIDLQVIDANLAAAGNQSFGFIGDAAFSAAGQIRATTDNGTATVEVNNDNDLVADMTIILSTTGTVLETWFIL